MIAAVAQLALVTVPAPTGAALPAGTTDLLSRSAGGLKGNAFSTFPAISDDGRIVAFTTRATNFNPTDFDAAEDVYVKDRQTGQLRLVSTSSAGVKGNGQSFLRGLSADGRKALIESGATNLVPGGEPGNYLKDLVTGAISFISFGQAVLSADGNRVAYGIGSEVRVRDLSTGATFVANTSTGGVLGNGSVDSVSISGDGTRVAFSSTSTNLDPGDTDTADDIYVKDLPTGVLTLASTTTNGVKGNSFSQNTAISRDGLKVAFMSTATNFAPPLGLSQADVYLKDLTTGALVLVSKSSSGTRGDGGSHSPAISRDGRRIAFRSRAGNLGFSDPGNQDIYVKDVASQQVFLASSASDGTKGDADSGSFQGQALGVLSGDGRDVVFESAATNLHPGDTDFFGDIFVKRLPGPSPGDYDGSGTTDIAVYRPSNGTWFVRNGVTAVWGASGDVPVPGDYDGNGTTDIAVYRPSSGTWFVRNGVTALWGASGDLPVPADYDGNGTTDVAVYRPSSGTWFVRNGVTASWGASGDIPVPGDYDRDGRTDIAVYRPSTGTWFVRNGVTAVWGGNGDMPVPGDYDGDGTADIAVYRPSTGTWFLRDAVSPGAGTSIGWGLDGDVPVPGDYDGDGVTDIAVYRPSTGTWFVRGGVSAPWGASDDVPLPLPAAIKSFFP